MAQRVIPAPTPTLPPTPVARRRRGWWRLSIMVVAIVMLVCEGIWWRVTATHTQFAGPAFNQHTNAIWIAHTWVGDSHTPADYDTLADELRQGQITYVYAHVGPLDGDGTIPSARYLYAADFVQAMHQRLPQLRVLAWIGQIYRAGAGTASDVVDLTVSATRQQIATTSAHFTRDLGFDGIQYDLEPIPNNDSHFLDLLRTTRQMIGPQVILAVTTPNWVPVARVADAMRAITGREDTWWTTYYYERVSQLVDQLDVMLYNTGMPTAPLYQAFAQQETEHILRAVQNAPSTATVVIGLPTYRDPPSRAFPSAAENMTTGLRGVIAGLNTATDHPAFGGVAIYPEWVMTPADWQTYDQIWLGQ